MTAAPDAPGLALAPYVWDGPYAVNRVKHATRHDDGLVAEVRAPWMAEGERLILRTSEIVGCDTAYLYDDHFPTQEQEGRGRGYRHIAFRWDVANAPRKLVADCTVPGRGRFGVLLAAGDDFVDIELAVRNDQATPMRYVDWYFCVIGLESPTFADGALDRTFLFDGGALRPLAELSGPGRGEDMYAVTGLRGADGFIPPLHAGLRRGPIEAQLPLVLVGGRDRTHTVALGFERAHSIFSSTVNRCFHADPFFGFDVMPGQERRIRGRLYVVQGSPAEALGRFRADFPSPQQGVAAPEPEPMAASAPVQLVLGADADPLECFAAEELRRYLRRLFDLDASIGQAANEAAATLVLLGRAPNHPMLAAALAPDAVDLSDQGFLLRTLGLRTGGRERPAVLIAGGRPAAVLWGVYELVERYGVRYLLDRDVFPEPGASFHLPAIDRVFEPAFRARAWRTMGDFAMGTEAWGMADYRPLLDQLAKLKFNRIRMGSAPWQPFMDPSLPNAQRRFATLWYDYRYPVTADMPGRARFDDSTEFWNRDLPPRDAGHDALTAAGERLSHELIAHAHRRGIEAEWHASVLDFPREFADLVPEACPVRQLGELTIGPGPGVRPDDARLLAVAGAALRSVLARFPEADWYGFAMPEFRAWGQQCAWAWHQLDERHRIGEIVSLEQVLQQAGARHDYPGGAARALDEVRGDVAALYFFDLLLTSPEVLPRSCVPDARFIVYNVSEELLPIVPRVLGRAAEVAVTIDYTSSRVLRRRHVLATNAARAMATNLIVTLHDDNVGLMPQLATGSIHQLLGDMRRHGWHGFFTRQWMISDHDGCVGYLSRASWHEGVTPRAVYADLVRAVCGDAAVGPMLKAFAHLEATTIDLEMHGLGLTFPVPGMLSKQWRPGSFTGGHASAREGYRRAAAALARVPAPSTADGRAWLASWRNRLAFGIGYIDVLESVSAAATAESAARGARQRGGERVYQEQLAEAVRQTGTALERAIDAIEAMARAARNRSDDGAIATLGEYAYRFLKKKHAALAAEASGDGS